MMIGDPEYYGRFWGFGANMPKDTVQKAIQRGAGGLDGANYEEIRYEGYGIGGAAIIIDCMTDNRIRTVAEVRHALSKNGGNLGTDGSVAFLFKHCGQFLFEPGTPEDKVMEAAIDAGAEDVVSDDEGGIEVVCAPGDTFDPAMLLALRVINKIEDGLKVLGSGELTRKITVKAHLISAAAKQKIEAAGGSVELIAEK